MNNPQGHSGGFAIQLSLVSCASASTVAARSQQMTRRFPMYPSVLPASMPSLRKLPRCLPLQKHRSQKDATSDSSHVTRIQTKVCLDGLVGAQASTRHRRTRRYCSDSRICALQARAAHAAWSRWRKHPSAASCLGMMLADLQACQLSGVAAQNLTVEVH